MLLPGAGIYMVRGGGSCRDKQSGDEGQRVQLMYVQRDVTVAVSMRWAPRNPHLGAPQSSTMDSGGWVPSGSTGGFSLPARPPLQECGICEAARREPNPPRHPTPVAKAPASVG
ncbi:unnamed protein product [Rangifer tarandus platyrhynchus]|uniref:Uncharacterized protein n=1 Tax=Rangifer tarandus platyrhynchus TaxID=3082113 RepID=A0AC59YPU2_RANTA